MSLVVEVEVVVIAAVAKLTIRVIVEEKIPRMR